MIHLPFICNPLEYEHIVEANGDENTNQIPILNSNRIYPFELGQDRDLAFRYELLWKRMVMRI